MNFKSLMAISVMTLILSACGDTGTFPPADSSNNGSNGGNNSGSINVRTADGGFITLQGTYSSDCFDNGIDSHIIDGNSFIVRFTAYSTADCSGDPISTSDIITATMSVGSDGTGPWVDGENSLIQAPTAADGQDLLPELAAFTRINLSILGVSGPVIYYVVDNSGSAPILYRDNNDNVTNSISTADPLTLQ